MKTTSLSLLLPTGLLLAWAAPWTCQTYSLPDGGTTNVNPGPDGGSGSRGDVSQGVDAGSGGPPCTGITVIPANPTLNVDYPVPGTLPLTANCVLAGGGTVPVAATWFTTHPDLVSVDSATGLVTANGPRGGPAVVTAGYQGFVASTTITVIVTQTVFAGAGPGAASCFAPAAGGGGPAFVYPNDQVVVPVNIQPIDFQWQPGSGSLYQLKLTGTYANLIAYVQAPFNAPPYNAGEPSWEPAPSVWAPFVHSNEAVTLTLQVSAANLATCAVGPVKEGPIQTLTLASSRMAGTIYYWAVNLGAILQIPAGTSTALPVNNPAGGCIACHAVSPDGTKLSAELWGGGNPGTIMNLTTTPTTPIVTVAPSWDFSTFDSTGNLMVVSNSGGLTLRDSATAAPVPAGTGPGNLTSIGCGVGGNCTQPVWSRDGANLVFAKVTPGYFWADWAFSSSSLMISNWAAGPQTFSPPTTLVTDNFDGANLANVYPTISSDDSLVAFTRSPCAYGSGCPWSAKLDMVPLAGGAPIELLAAEGGDTSLRFPNFSPFKEGGYHWMAFFSLRKYGWVTSNRRQIWIAAVDDNPAPAGDTSHPGFWLAGQNTNSENDKAEWATLPCASHGDACQGDIDCCTGLVCDSATNVCLTPTEACTTSWTYTQTFNGPGLSPEFDLWQWLNFTFLPSPLDPAVDIAVAVRVAQTPAALASATPVPVCDLRNAPICTFPQALPNLSGRYIAIDFTFTHASCTSIPNGSFPEITSVNATALVPGN